MSAQGPCHLCGEPTMWVCAPDGDYGWVYCCSQHDHEEPTTPAHPPLSTTGAESDTGTHTERESAAQRQGEPQ